MPTEMDWARLAAFIDGEGCISLARRRDKYRNKPTHSGNTHCIVSVQVTNTDPRLMQWCLDTFGGCVRNGQKPTPNRRQHYVWYPRNNEIGATLRGCLPFFIIKREQADIALAFRSLVERKSHRGQRIEQPEFEVRKEMYNRIHLLNSVGPRKEAGLKLGIA